jgi:maltose O-acetyltransferase
MIRSANKEEAGALTEISFSSKGHWRYPREYLDIWENELTISPDYIEKNDVFVYEEDGVARGYYSIVELASDLEVSDAKITKGFWLHHMFIEPSHIGKGVGSRMFEHLREWCAAEGIEVLGILADPNAKGFYEKMGCEYVREFPSTIKNRTTPYFVLHL